MNRRRPVIFLLVLAAALPVFGAGAFDRGSVLTEVTRNNAGLLLWQPQWDYAVELGLRLIDAPVPYASSEGQFFVAAPNKILFHFRGTMYVWDGVHRRFDSADPGYSPIFHEDAAMTEIAPMRSGNFLVAGEKLIEFNTRGRVAEHALPQRAEFLELLADQCTVLYSAGRVVHRFDRCTGESGGDFATMLFDENAGSIRALPDGDVLVANALGVLRYSPAGVFRSMYLAPGVTHIALTPDATEFLAGGTLDGRPFLDRFALTDVVPEQDIPLGNPGMQSLPVPERVTELVVAGEWRASSPPPAPSRTRSARH